MSWEQRMSERAHGRELARQAEAFLAESEADAAREVEWAASGAPGRTYVGACDICHEPFKIFVRSDQIVDIYIDESGIVMTYARHYATAPPGADPKCAVYSSRLYSA